MIISLEKNNGVTGDTSTPLNRRKSFKYFILIDVEERERERERERGGNQKHTDFYLPHMQEESDNRYTKPQDKQIKLN